MHTPGTTVLYSNEIENRFPKMKGNDLTLTKTSFELPFVLFDEKRTKNSDQERERVPGPQCILLIKYRKIRRVFIHSSQGESFKGGAKSLRFSCFFGHTT